MQAVNQAKSNMSNMRITQLHRSQTAPYEANVRGCMPIVSIDRLHISKELVLQIN